MKYCASNFRLFIYSKVYFGSYLSFLNYLLYSFFNFLVGWVIANGPEDLGSIPGRVIPKTQKMVLNTSLLNTQPYKERIKDKVGQSREKSSTLPYTSV